MASNDLRHAEGGSPFWRFSLSFYSRPGVAEACLDLQDRCGVDVNLLLFLLWMATAGAALPTGAVKELDDAVGDWRDGVVVPLRVLRRTLKAGTPLIAGDAATAFRDRIKALELEAERLQQEAMHGLAASFVVDMADSVAVAARTSLTAYQSVSSRDFPAETIAVLLDALAAAGRGMTPLT